MDVRVVRSADLQNRTPEQISAYLLSKGWQNVHSELAATVWVNESADRDEEIWLPRSKDFRGYTARLAEAFNTLSRVENRPVLQITFDVTHALNDIQRIRTFPKGESGTVPLTETPTMIEGIRHLVISAAHLAALPEPKLVQPSHRPPVVTEFISHVRLAAPQEGSFIWTIMVPIAQEKKDQMLPLPGASEDPHLNDFNRRVTMSLLEASQVVRDACKEVKEQPGDITSPFNSRVSKGVSANICEALVATSGESKNPIELSFSWALHRPAPKTASVRFNNEDLNIMQDVAAEFRRTTPQRDVSVKGIVVRLLRKSDQKPGRITVAGFTQGSVQGRLGNYWLELDGEEYKKALRAHRDNREVTVTGTLARRGNYRWLEQAQNFTIIG